MNLLPQSALPIDPQEFADVISLASEAAAGRIELNPLEYYIPWHDPQSGAETQISLQDTTFNRMMLALKEHYRTAAPEKYMSVTWRLFALTELLRAGVLAEWVTTSGPGSTSFIPDCVINVAAAFPLAGSTGFERKGFIAAVRASRCAG
jgi:hypothetical protein